MKSRFFTIASQKNSLITIQFASGHFATGSSHISHYIDISELKSSAAAAKEAARELAIPYYTNNIIDVIVYLEGTEIIAAYLADELLKPGLSVMNSDSEIRVITPMNSVHGNFIFHENIQEKIKNKNIMLMVASISTGATVKRAMQCIAYYGGNLVGVSAVFSAFPEISHHEVHSLFTYEDIPGYRFYKPSDCDMCKAGNKLDALINSEGYTQI